MRRTHSVPPTLVLLSTTLLLCAVTTLASAQDKKPVVTVRTISDGDSPVFKQQHEELKREVLSLLGLNKDLIFDAAPQAADWTAAGVTKLLDQAYADPEVTVVIGLGVVTTGLIAGRQELGKPTILPFVVQADVLGLPRQGDSSGRKNLNYVSTLAHAKRGFERLMEVSACKHAAVVLGPLSGSDKARVQAYLADAAKTLSLKVTLVESAVTPEAILAALPRDADAAVLGSLPRLSLAQRTQLLAGLLDRKVASLATGGPDWVEQGALMTLQAPGESNRRARRAGLQLRRILEGKDAGSLRVLLEPKSKLLINVATARSLAVNPSFQVLTEAEIVRGGGAPSDESSLTLRQAIAEAVAANLVLAREQAAVAAGEARVDSTRGPLLPQIGLTAGLTQINPDAAIIQAERQASWGVRGSQIIYSEAPWATHVAQQHAQDSIEEGYEVSRLDVMLSAGTAYLDVQRAFIIENIQRENLKRSRTNLELAKVRAAVGTADMSEVYRWRIELAQNQAAVIDASAMRNQAQIGLNQVLNREVLETAVTAGESAFNEESGTRKGDESLRGYNQSPETFDKLRDFMVLDAMEHSPEVRRIDASLRVERRTIEGRRRGMWMPTFSVEGGVEHRFWMDGQGSPGNTPPLAGVPDPVEFMWDVGVYLSMPLFTGASRLNDVEESAREIDRLDSERRRIVQAIDAGVRQRMHQGGAALAAIELTRNAAMAANKNLALVTDQYQQGTVDIIRLVDAQVASLQADLSANDAVFDYLTIALQVDRATGYFRFLQSEDDQTLFFDRLAHYFKTGAYELSPPRAQ